MREEIIKILTSRGINAAAEEGGCEGIRLEDERAVVIYPPDWWENAKNPQEGAEMIMKEWKS